jgi:hypothetical protein
LAHFFCTSAAAQVPPQSTSLSLPALSKPSLHVFATHERGAAKPQSPLAQSPSPAQRLLSAHLAEHAPPQSTSLSDPLRVRSRQGSDTHLLLPPQIPDAQSEPTLQFFPVAHGVPPHTPPQSTSASPALSAPFSHGPLMHLLLRHAFETQSLSSSHARDTAHLLQVSPPQSMADSLPFLRESLQPGSTQRFVRSLHSVVGAQSVSPPQAAPTPHLFGQLPPQSISASLPFSR